MPFLKRFLAQPIRRPPTLFLFFVVALIIRYFVSFTLWHFVNFPVQRYDPYLYVIKGLEIAHGDWSPIRTHAIGWPITLGIVFRFIGRSSLFENFVIASLASVFISALAIVPLYSIAKRVSANARALFLVMAFFCVSWPLTILENDSIAMSEPLFVFLFLSSIALLYAARASPRLMPFCGAIGGLAYWVRPNGIFILPILVISYWLWNRRRGMAACITHCALTACAFFLTAAPFLYERLIWFGSAFNYGENNHYFAESYTDAWGTAIPPISFSQYMATHSLGDYFNKFGIGGIGLITLMLAAAAAPHLLTVGCYAVSKARKNSALYPLWTAAGVWFISLIPVFHIYYNPRHLIPLAPFVLIASACGFHALIKNEKNQRALVAAGIIVPTLFMAMFFSFVLFFVKEKNIMMRDGMIWANQLSVMLKGTVAIGSGSDIFMMQFPDTQVGGRGMLSLTAPKSGVTVAYPGKVASMDALRPWFHANAIDYIVLDDFIKKSFPYAPDKHLSIYTGTLFPPYLTEIYSNYKTNSQWKIRVFSVNKKP